MDYWKELLNEAWQSSWNLVVARTLPTILVTAAIMAVSILWYHFRRQRDDAQKTIKSVGIAVLSTAVVFACILALYFLILTPRQLILKRDDELTKLRQTLAQTSATPAPVASPNPSFGSRETAGKIRDAYAADRRTEAAQRAIRFALAYDSFHNDADREAFLKSYDGQILEWDVLVSYPRYYGGKYKFNIHPLMPLDQHLHDTLVFEVVPDAKSFKEMDGRDPGKRLHDLDVVHVKGVLHDEEIEPAEVKILRHVFD